MPGSVVQCREQVLGSSRSRVRGAKSLSLVWDTPPYLDHAFCAAGTLQMLVGMCQWAPNTMRLQ